MFAIVIQASLDWKSILAAYNFSNFSILEVIFQNICGTYYSSCIQEVQTHNCIKHNILCNIWKNSALPIRSRIVHAVFAVTKLRTVKSFSEALILASVNPQYDERLFIELQEKYKIRTCFVQKLFFCFFFDIQNNICTQHVVNLYFLGNSMNNLSSYCGLTDSRMRASDTDLPVIFSFNNFQF